MNTEYEIEYITPFKFFLKYFTDNVPYYKIKNYTDKPITLYVTTKQIIIQQDFVNLKFELENDYTKAIKTDAKIGRTFRKIVIHPRSKRVIHYKKLLPIYWINEEEGLIYEIKNKSIFSKIIFKECNRYEEEIIDDTLEEIKEEIIDEDEIVEQIIDETVEEIIEEIIDEEDKKPITDYEKDMNKLNINFVEIDILLKSIQKMN